ncbi:response regulator transcription factor [Fundidesulfovibrio soli]|uniref:response regulator transcription factor n=1 Tax=Fundidesulfovibrio soli TaxID=2922716 RepID=UPI001FAF80E2|nr:response regulator transcription factor [Fundidesulfovibrio soli]
MTPGMRVFLVDDHPAVRQGLALLLGQERHTVCGEAGGKAEFLERVGASGAQIALVDLSLGEESGLALLEELRRRGIPALIYSMHEDAETIERAFAAGAGGYVTKREVSSVLLDALAEVAAGGRYVSPRAGRSLVERGAPGGAGQDAGALSEREGQILGLLGRGESAADIAAALSISARTVESYCARIMDKLGLSGMKALKKHAIQRMK